MKRLQRLRATAALRDLVAETGFGRAQLIQPLFVAEGLTSSEPLAALPGNRRLAVSEVAEQVERDLASGVRHFILFPVPAQKRTHNFLTDFACDVVARLKGRFAADLTLWVDTCLCSYSHSGHCCLFDSRGQQDLPQTLSELASLACAYVAAGADGISPSDMNDGRVAHLRAALDSVGAGLKPLMSYSAKFASNFYGPFRDAADSAPQFGDRRAYQLDVRSRRDAIAASVRCAEEGADLLMVKPGMTSIDLIAPIAAATGLPVGAYQVSGEYAALALLAREGYANFNAALLESWYVLRRAGASYIITYGARDAGAIGLA